MFRLSTPVAVQAIRESPDDCRVDSERALWRLWLRVADSDMGFVTQDGAMLRVLYPGRPNGRAGPDFLNAILLDESGNRITGDVEAHLNAPDWFAHHHDTDANYNGVVLHVVLHPKGAVSSPQKSGMTARVLELPVVRNDTDDSAKNAASQNADISEDWEELCGHLDRLGDARFSARVQGFASELGSIGPEQVLYASVMESLGYASNRKPFRKLAQFVGIVSLARFKTEPLSIRTLAISAALIKSAGLIESVHDASQRSVFRRWAKHLPVERKMSRSDWTTFRVRPANHPIRRMAGGAELFGRYLDTGLVSGITDSVRCATRPADVTNAVAAPPGIGRQRAAQIVVDVVLPFVTAYARMRGDNRLAETSISHYRGFPALQGNEITREMMKVLGGIPEGLINSARRQQGLTKLYRDMPATRNLLIPG